MTLAALSQAILLPVAVQAGSNQRNGGCRAWAAIFRPVLPILGGGQIEVALPAYVPPLGPSAFAHATVLRPPRTYRVTVTTSRSERIVKTTVLLIIHGNAGNHLPSWGSAPAALSNGKSLYLRKDVYGFAGLSWFYRSGGLTYTVAAPAFVPLATLARITGSLVPAPLRRTPITAGTGGPSASPCP